MIWEDGFWPDWLWQVLENLVPFGAIVAFIGTVVWLWNHGPAVLIKYGPDWFTTIGHWWDEKREDT